MTETGRDPGFHPDRTGRLPLRSQGLKWCGQGTGCSGEACQGTGCSGEASQRLLALRTVRKAAGRSPGSS